MFYDLLSLISVSFAVKWLSVINCGQYVLTIQPINYLTAFSICDSRLPTVDCLSTHDQPLTTHRLGERPVVGTAFKHALINHDEW